MNKGLHAVRVKRFSALAPPPLGTVLYYPGLPGFGSTIIDRSGKENHGAISGAAWTRLLSGLMVLDFNGSSNKVDCGNSAVFDITSTITLMAWAYTNAIGASDQWIISKATATDQSYTLGIQDVGGGTSGGLVFIHHGVAERNSLVSLTAGIWYHLAATLDGANARLYINGSLNNTIADSSAISVSPGNLTIGSRSTPNELFYMNGRIGLPRIISRALSSAEIAKSYEREHRLFGV